MGYFKTLTIDPSAAREYSQRWAQNDQVVKRPTSTWSVVKECYDFDRPHSSTVGYPTQRTQKDQVREREELHLVSSHGGIKLQTTATLAQPVNPTREHVGRALHAWRKNVEHNPRDLNALNRASLNLEANPWYLTPDGELVITSATDSRKRYHVTVDGCDCRAAMSGRACWHVAAYKVLHTAEAMRRMEGTKQNDSPAHNPHCSRAGRHPQDETCTADAILAYDAGVVHVQALVDELV